MCAMEKLLIQKKLGTASCAPWVTAGGSWGKSECGSRGGARRPVLMVQWFKMCDHGDSNPRASSIMSVVCRYCHFWPCLSKPQCPQCPLWATQYPLISFLLKSATDVFSSLALIFLFQTVLFSSSSNMIFYLVILKPFWCLSVYFKLLKFFSLTVDIQYIVSRILQSD